MKEFQEELDALIEKHWEELKPTYHDLDVDDMENAASAVPVAWSLSIHAQSLTATDEAWGVATRIPKWGQSQLTTDGLWMQFAPGL